MYSENRYRVLQKTDPARAKVLLEKAQKLTNDHYALYKYMAERKISDCEVKEEVKTDAK